LGFIRERRLLVAHQGEEIVNARTGQRMVFLQTARDTDGDLLQIESFNPPHGLPEPEHVHPLQESRAEVLAGELHFSIRGNVRVVRAGETIVIPANTPHDFWNGGDEDAHSVQEFRPALRIDSFFESWFGLARDGKLNEKGMPSLLQLAVMVPAFGDEIRPTSPPWGVLRALSGLLGPIARARGYRSVYPYRNGSASGSATD
jgi:quercetin dioxygenase-like cupin family protein